jgi:hypothetical protein
MIESKADKAEVLNRLTKFNIKMRSENLVPQIVLIDEFLKRAKVYSSGKKPRSGSEFFRFNS